MTKKEIVYFIERFIPHFLLIKYRKRKNPIEWKEQQILYKEAVSKVAHKDGPLNVLFLVLYPSVWKYDSVYQQMMKDPMFNPVILICPVLDRGHEHMVETLNATQQLFEQRGYRAVLAYDQDHDKYRSVDEFNPDILMYAFQWTSHTAPMYDLEHTKKYLKCYVNYSYKNNPFSWSIASSAQSMMWLYFSECEDNKKLIYSIAEQRFHNVRVVGYPLYDEVQALKATGKDWKIQDPNIKRIIWAPHHTIEGNDTAIKLSTFLLFSDTMVEFAKKYKGQIQIAFKPHPELKPALYAHPKWGKERTDAYYQWWAENDNTNYVMGAYIDLFKSSDALIHDCHSFTVEYLYVNKPVMYMTNYDRESQCNEVGKKALRCHYHGQTVENIEMFIKDVVIGGEDTMRDVRTKFYENILVPPNGKSVAENIIDSIKNEINKSI